MQTSPLVFTTVITILICVFTVDSAPLSEGIFGQTEYKGQRKFQNDFFSEFFPKSRLTDPKLLPKKSVVVVEPQKNFNALQDAACTITYDGECVPEAQAILPKNIYSRTICGPGWVCYE
ncbi:hypothetical protein LOTGIDRAFT_231065 [Lottia gigantea]|uniref:Uncharacterized protein n=1 Tax=Lottia gigantea TaxID=225164 RepID=V4A684_LOTGI|nr:hypothetical protein LOTGIDRAFT_231065 [Lottia gigantea]ESO99403.1 hypothetical protein LOTGIDRAFT_231065 [Lottia gigantea]